ncbi:hypothetical protein [Achromobacter xylosoxidans]|uniref:hypothetical protein n=1 Tax=Alcaligenes xylosoxydans xylosoxydans TaxID=85698 RepID=UPI000AC5369F|nr:hypothetical protein [Achromobacter xylosoxidans]
MAHPPQRPRSPRPADPKPVRQNYRLVPIAGTENQLVLGLAWQTLLGEDLAREALRTARRNQATHYTQSGARSPAVGLLKASGKESRAKTRSRLFSAAAAFALAHGHGPHVVSCALADGAIWLAVAVDGVVQAGGDRILRNAAEAQTAIDEAKARYGDIQLYSNEVAGALPFSLPQLAALANEQCALRRASFKLSMISPAWWVALGLLLAYLAWDSGASWWQERQIREQQRQQALHPVVDAAGLWKQALTTWANSIRVDGNAGLAQILAAIARVPAAPGRWQLVEVDCQPATLSCSALYRRTRLADNPSLRAALPRNWDIQWLNLDNASARLPIPADERPSEQQRGASAPTVKVMAKVLALADMPTANAVNELWAPQWQALRPALTDFTLSPAAAVPVPAPNIKLPDGLEQPVALPVGMTLPQARELVINAPLRSFYALSLPPTSAITQLQVRYAPQVQPALLTSQFMATLKGTIYVQSP